MRQNKILCKVQLYSEHQVIYFLRVKIVSRMSTVDNHEGRLQVADKLHMPKTYLSILAYKQITIVSCNK